MGAHPPSVQCDEDEVHGARPPSVLRKSLVAAVDGRRKSGRLGAAHLRGGGVGARTTRRLRPDLLAPSAQSNGIPWWGEPAATAWSASPEEKREEGWGMGGTGNALVQKENEGSGALHLEIQRKEEILEGSSWGRGTL